MGAMPFIGFTNSERYERKKEGTRTISQKERRNKDNKIENDLWLRMGGAVVINMLGSLGWSKSRRIQGQSLASNSLSMSLFS